MNNEPKHSVIGRGINAKVLGDWRRGWNHGRDMGYRGVPCGRMGTLASGYSMHGQHRLRCVGVCGGRMGKNSMLVGVRPCGVVTLCDFLLP